MTNRSVILLGGPDSGKSNYIGRLWPALDAKTGMVVATQQPADIGYVLDTADHLFQGRFAPRTEHNEERRDFEVPVALADGSHATSIVIPDISGELWQTAVRESEIAQDWLDELDRAHGALLFMRVGSDQDVRPLDWVTSRKLLAKIGQDEDREKLPTQVMVCEFIRYLELTMGNRGEEAKPRLSVIVAAWDRVDQKTFSDGPRVYLEKEYPLIAGRLRDTAKLEISFFGLSVVGGDLNDDPEFREQYLEKGLDEHGWVAVSDAETGHWVKDKDLTRPIAWAIGA
ncbi:hypothetical protein FHS26_006884 [Rhizobium pisi]|uniref:Double-GTPase 1 domain-containing protein n=1 Tax=Rhizobium pisi TaxID=574561 RepID=A0A7W5BUQ9_9HYPH|nr:MULTISPECIES: hypothetical protein [Rhizobium]MBB3139103.1 hypothetical protein [Rhizobium pisi]MBY5494469.1 hypothetical protein [Rhizobium leguminosarum]TCA37986.1 hypothetical protein E0H72_26700 [Rhizobium leguminosarum bv. viciae]TCA48162.1 hypothetical protein E0H71_30425 [Rhizobium leguminosarum bv. viciae]